MSFLKRLFGKKSSNKDNIPSTTRTSLHVQPEERNGMIYYDYLSFDELSNIVEYYEPRMSNPIPMPDGKVIPLLQKEYQTFSSKKQKSFWKTVSLITRTCRNEITPSYIQTLVMQYKDPNSKYFVVLKKNPNHHVDIVSIALIRYEPTLIADALEDIQDNLKDIKSTDYPALVFDLHSEMNINIIPKGKRNLDAEDEDGDEDGNSDDDDDNGDEDSDDGGQDDNLHQYATDLFVIHMFCAIKETTDYLSTVQTCEQLPYVNYGFGTTLLKRVEDYLLSKFKPQYNKNSILLLIDRPSANAISFYERNGYMLDQQEVTVKDSKGRQKTEIINTLLSESMFKFMPLTPVKRKINRRVERMTKFIAQNAPYLPHLIPSEVVPCFQALQLIPDEEVSNISYDVVRRISGNHQMTSLDKIKEWYQSPEIPVIVRDGMLCSLISLYNIDCVTTRIPFEINRTMLDDFLYRRIEPYIYFKTTNKTVTSGLIAYRSPKHLNGLMRNDDVFDIDILSFAMPDTQEIKTILPIVTTNMRGRSTSRYTLFKIPYDDRLRDANYAKYRTVLDNLGFQKIEGHREMYLAFDTSGNKVDANTLFQKDVPSSHMGGKPIRRSRRVTRRVSWRSSRSSMRRRLKK
jgi:hypothetical protein